MQRPKYHLLLQKWKEANKSKSSKGNLIPKSSATLSTLILKPFHPTPKFRKIFRWKITTAIVGQTVTQANIFAAWVLATSAGAVRSLMASMKILSVKAIATGFSATSIDELYIRDANQQGVVDPVDSTSTGEGNTLVQWKPDPKSLTSDWFNFGTGGSCFTLSVPVGAILELDCEYVNPGAAGTGATATYAATVTTGIGYSMGLDGSAGSIYYAAIGMNQA